MLKNSIPLGVSLLFVILFQLFNNNTIESKQSGNKITNEALQTIEVKGFLGEFNPFLSQELLRDKVSINSDSSMIGSISIVNADQYRKWIGKINITNATSKDTIIDSSILNFSTPNSTISKARYIKLKAVRNGAYQSFMKGMERLAGHSGYDTLYLDLRNCSSGLDQEAIKIANQLVYDADVMMMKEMFFNGTINKINSRGKVFFPLKKIFILVNEQTSGVSELLIRMIQKGSQVEILGKPTVGAHLIMRFFPLSNGKYLFFPIGYYCNDCEKVDQKYDQRKLNPILPNINLSDIKMDSLLKQKFDISL